MAIRNTRSRRQQILQQLLEQGSVQVADLVGRYGVSAVTIRTDLGHFEEQGLATRTHGGATLVRTPPQEQDIHEKDALNLPLKESIGARAAQLVQPGDNIIIDSGSTTMTLARHLRGHRQQPRRGHDPRNRAHPGGLLHLKGGQRQLLAQPFIAKDGHFLFSASSFCSVLVVWTIFCHDCAAGSAIHSNPSTFPIKAKTG